MSSIMSDSRPPRPGRTPPGAGDDASSRHLPPEVPAGGILRSVGAPLSASSPAGDDTEVLAASAPKIASAVSAGRKPLTVTELTGELRALLQGHFADLYVEGEVSGCRPAASGHVYFTLKDAKAAISCVMWAGTAARLSKPLRDGDKVEIRGDIDVYAQRGTYQIIVLSLRPAGLGRLYQAYLELKERLDQEGLFDEARKRELPPHPRVVGVVTSPTGAVIRDILNVLGRRAPHVSVLLYPARVQGDGAAREVAHAIRRFNALAAEARRGTGDTALCSDVLIVGRGGGSLEDLWAFNEEIVARAIFESDLPVISAVGHETDFTIADFVADKRAPTPSAAAELVARDSGEMLRHLEHTTRRLQAALQHRLAPLKQGRHLEQRLKQAFLPRVISMRNTLRAFRKSAAFQRPFQKVNEERMRLDDLHGRMLRRVEERAREAARCHERISAQLRALDPRAVLSRGYSITFDARTGKPLRRAEDIQDGLALRIVLHEGEIRAIAGEGKPPALTDEDGTSSADLPAPPPAAPRRRRRKAAPALAATPDLFTEKERE